jgi:hypothetical protein
LSRFLISVFLIFIATGIKCQQRPDSLPAGAKKRVYSKARVAGILSAVIPGAGQVYNGKIWKLPFIYAGLGGFAYMFTQNNSQYLKFRDEVRAKFDTDSSTVTEYYWLTGQQLKDERDYYRKNRDFAVIGFVIVYIINIIDANVDAHLKTFDISDELSLRLEHWENLSVSGGLKPSAGLRLVLCSGQTQKRKGQLRHIRNFFD